MSLLTLSGEVSLFPVGLLLVATALIGAIWFITFQRKERFAGMLAGVMIFALCSYGYLFLRYNGHAADSDTALMSLALQSTAENGHFTQGPAMYPHGMGYAAISLFIQQLTGLPIAIIQRVIQPWIISTLLLPLLLFVTYRALLRHNQIAILAAFGMFLQADFVWVTWRGSHERFIWAFGLAVLWLATQRFRGRYLLLGLALFAFVSTNYVFAGAFMLALGLAALVGFTLEMLRARSFLRWCDLSPDLRSLLIAAAVGSGMVYLFAFHLYPPAASTIRTFGELIARLQNILLNHAPASEYASTLTNLWWNSGSLYILLSVFNWLVLLAASWQWLHWARRFLARRTARKRIPLLYVLYPAMVVQLAAAVAVDRAGFLGGNFVVRVFAPLMLMAVPLAAEAMYRRLRHPAARRAHWMALGAAITACLSVLMLVKTSSEPGLNTRWIFATGQEAQGVNWCVRHEPGAVIWSGADERFESAIKTDAPSLFIRQRPEVVWGIRPRLKPTYYLISDLEQQRWQRLGLDMPSTQQDDQIYTNGRVTIFQDGR